MATKPQMPEEHNSANTDSCDSLLFVCETPGDTTRRPGRPNLSRPSGPVPEAGERSRPPDRPATEPPLPSEN
jgi:hypothetical protein